MACKRRSSVHHRSGKTAAFCGFVQIQRPNSPKLLHAHFILVSSIDSAESNGVQKAFLGKPKIKVSFHKLSQKRLRLTIQCYILSTKLRFWTTVVFGLAQFFAQQLLCELPITQYCVVGVGYIYVSDTFQAPKSDIRSLCYQSWCIVIEMLKTYNTMYCVKCVSYCKTISCMHVAQVPV